MNIEIIAYSWNITILKQYFGDFSLTSASGKILKKFHIESRLKKSSSWNFKNVKQCPHPTSSNDFKSETKVNCFRRHTATAYTPSFFSPHQTSRKTTQGNTHIGPSLNIVQTSNSLLTQINPIITFHCSVPILAGGNRQKNIKS